MSSNTCTPAPVHDLPTLAAHFGAAAAAATEHDAATNAVCTAEAEILAHVIQLARPAVRHVAKRINEDWIGEQTDGMGGYERSTPFPQRGVVLAGDLGCQLGGRDDTRGEIEGRALVLWADGSLAVVTTEARWTRWARECSTKSRTDTPVTPAEALAEWELESCLKAPRPHSPRRRPTGSAEARRRTAARRAAPGGADHPAVAAERAPGPPSMRVPRSAPQHGRGSRPCCGAERRAGARHSARPGGGTRPRIREPS